MVSIKKLDETPIKLVLDLMHQYVQLQGPKSTSDPPKTPLNVVRLLCVIPQSLRLIMQFQMISRYLLYHQQCSNEEEGGGRIPPSSYVSQKPIQFRVKLSFNLPNRFLSSFLLATSSGFGTSVSFTSIYNDDRSCDISSGSAASV